MGTITDRTGKVLSQYDEDTLEDWRQAAEVEARIRREFQEKHEQTREALARLMDWLSHIPPDRLAVPKLIAEAAQAALKL